MAALPLTLTFFATSLKSSNIEFVAFLGGQSLFTVKQIYHQVLLAVTEGTSQIYIRTSYDDIPMRLFLCSGPKSEEEEEKSHGILSFSCF